MFKNVKLPDTLVILSSILVIITILTWIIPPGEFERAVKAGRSVVVPGTYHNVESAGQGIFDLLLSPIKGFIAAAQIIAFVLIVGGSFKIIQESQAIQGGLQQMIGYAQRNPRKKNLIIPLLTILFSLAGATFGMSEETLVFVLITIPLAHSLGYDTLVGVAIPFLGAGAGFAGAFSNPFTIGIAQGIAELPPFSGFGYRFLLWVLLTTVTVSFIFIYARNIEKNPSKGFKSRNIGSDNLETTEDLLLTTRRKIVLWILILGIVMLIIGATQLGWYINEIAGLFLVMGILSAVVYRFTANDTAEHFMQGAREMLVAAMVIGFSRGIVILAEDGKIIDTMMFAAAELMNDMPSALTVEGMFIFQSILNFFIPSGSGQAALTMPIMVPLSDLTGISRQTAVMAFQLGDGLSNMIIPTSGVTMGILAIAKIPYQTWLKWALPLVLILALIGMIMLIPPVVMFHYGPF